MNKNEIMTPQEILRKYPEINRAFDEHDHGRLEIIQAMEEYHQAMQQKQTGEAMNARYFLIDKNCGDLVLNDRKPHNEWQYTSDLMELYHAYRLQQAQNVDWEGLENDFKIKFQAIETFRPSYIVNWFHSKLSGCSGNTYPYSKSEQSQQIKRLQKLGVNTTGQIFEQMINALLFDAEGDKTTSNP